MNAAAAWRPWCLAPAGLVLTALVLAGCGERHDDQSAGQKVDAAIAKTQDVAGRAAEKAGALAEVARDKVVAAEPAIREGAASAGEAARNAGHALANTADDVSITAAVSKEFAKDAELSASRIDVDTQRGAVTLRGPAPNAAAKARAGDIAQGIKGVSRVDNALEVRAM